MTESSDWFVGQRAERELARHMHNVQGTCMVSVQNAGEQV